MMVKRASILQTIYGSILSMGAAGLLLVTVMFFQEQQNLALYANISLVFYAGLLSWLCMKNAGHMTNMNYPSYLSILNSTSLIIAFLILSYLLFAFPHISRLYVFMLVSVLFLPALTYFSDRDRYLSGR
jgi:hypothetical protein